MHGRETQEADGWYDSELTPWGTTPCRTKCALSSVVGHGSSSFCEGTLVSLMSVKPKNVNFPKTINRCWFSRTAGPKTLQPKSYGTQS